MDSNTQGKMDKQAHTTANTRNKKHYVTLCTTMMEHWGCDIKKALPADLAPRERNPNGSRVAISQHHDRTRLHPKEWTRTFCTQLTLLASNTMRGHEVVVKELRKQVKLRQKQKTHPLHYVREPLTSELDIVIEHFSRQEYNADRKSVDPTEDGFDFAEESEDETRSKIRRMRELRRSKRTETRGEEAVNKPEAEEKGENEAD
ncbi:hypothetical protein CBER1_04039 [Cercospora berteroae]|uniref:Uncharacterized protein n=1 Tax=Cercospora berteroae TaxID=357750 RepID=A0A2S6C4U6_9PEZI|nr:hypothetical protein CBER1_04039 [Cercospora berteroae]